MGARFSVKYNENLSLIEKNKRGVNLLMKLHSKFQKKSKNLYARLDHT